MAADAMGDSEREGFLGQMDREERRAYERMRSALESPAEGPAWHHRFGTDADLVLQERGGVRKRGWAERLPRALGCSRSLVGKSRQFAAQHTEEEARAMEAEGFAWSVVSATLPLGKSERLRWMGRARKEEWNLPELQAEIQRHLKGPLRKGGRKPRAARSHGLSVDLAVLLRLTGEWLRRDRRVWSASGAGLLAQLGGMPAPELAVLLPRVEDAAQAMADLAAAASALAAGLISLSLEARKAQAQALTLEATQ